jgi:hypothetical protein
MIRHSLIDCSVDQLAPRAISYWQPLSNDQTSKAIQFCF